MCDIYQGLRRRVVRLLALLKYVVKVQYSLGFLKGYLLNLVIFCKFLIISL